MKERDIFFDPLKTEEDMFYESIKRLRFEAKCEEEQDNNQAVAQHTAIRRKI